MSEAVVSWAFVAWGVLWKRDGLEDETPDDGYYEKPKHVVLLLLCKVTHFLQFKQ